MVKARRPPWARPKGGGGNGLHEQEAISQSKKRVRFTLERPLAVFGLDVGVHGKAKGFEQIHE